MLTRLISLDKTEIQKKLLKIFGITKSINSFASANPANRFEFFLWLENSNKLSVDAWVKFRHFLILVPKIAWLYNWGMLVSGVAGRPPKNICLRSISNFSVSGCAGYWNWRSHLRQIFFGVRPATPDTITVHNRFLAKSHPPCLFKPLHLLET